MKNMLIETTVQEGVSDLSAEELEKTFEETLKTFTVLWNVLLNENMRVHL